MKNSSLKFAVALLSIFAISLSSASAQQYVNPTQVITTGKAPGLKVKLLSSAGQTKTYLLIFAPGDEVVAGLTDFAQRYHIKAAHYTAIGDATSAKVGYFDYDKKLFKVIPITSPAEITSLIGDIATLNGKPVAHSHINLAAADGLIHGGHLFEVYIGPTLELVLTEEPVSLQKKVDPRYGAGVIDIAPGK